MKKLIALLFVFLMFGCIGGDGEPVVEPEDNKTVIIDIGEGENQTVVKNETEDGEEENITEPWTGMNYTYDPSAKMGVYFLELCEYSTGNHTAAIFIKKGDFDMLIDTGSELTNGRVIDFVKSRNIDDIDVLVSSSADLRRAGGLLEIADEFEVEEFWWGGVKISQDYFDTIEAVSEKAKETNIVKRGYARELNGIEIEVLNPKTAPFSDVNNDAVVLRIEDRELSLLLLSNVQTGAQGDMISNLGDKLKVDFVEAPYYGVGAGTANIALFLQASHPKYMVIEGCSDETMEVEGSTRNPFKRVMAQEQYQVIYYETYVNGTVKITSDETGYGITLE